jgi:hypothetical protein
MMNKFIIALLAVMMLFVTGCASKPIAKTTPFTASEIGDSSPLEEVAAVDDEAVEDLPDMVPTES